LNLAHSDNSIVGAEIKYLKSVAIINNLGQKWFEEKMKNLKNSKFHFTLNQYIS